MNNFSYAQADTAATALALMKRLPGAKFLGGGTNLIDLMRERIEQPDALIDISRLPLTGVSKLADGGLRIGAMMRNSHLAADPLIRERYPLLSQAILTGASAQLRNMATTGGNLMQRTRCHYFYDAAARCNKRDPGAGCDAIDGFNRMHAVLGASADCVATHPSDMCVALAALDATVQVSGPTGSRSIALVDFHRLPGTTPHVDTTLHTDELITAVDLPALPWARRSAYRKIRDRASYAFALVSVAAALDTADGVIREVRIALGGVAHKPWRATQAERFLVGKACTDANVQQAAALELEAAMPLPHNGFKIALARRCIASLLMELSRLEVAPWA